MASPSGGSGGHRPSLVRLETKAVEEDARSKSARHLWRQLFEEFSEWIRSREEELVYSKLDNQLCEFLRGKYFEGKPRSFAVNMIRAVKFEVPTELGRDSLGRARNVVARWESGPWVELDPEKARAAALQALGTAAFCSFVGESLGLGPLLQLRGSAKGMPAAVDASVQRAFRGHFPNVSAEDWRGCKPLRQDLPAFLAHRLGMAGGAICAEGGVTSAMHPALRLVIWDSPAFLQLEMAGSAAFQMDGCVALLGKDILELNLDTVGLWFRGPRGKDVPLLQENNMGKSIAGGASEDEISDLGARLRQFADPQQLSDALQLLNPGTLSTLCMLFPDGKYDVALVQETFECYDLQGQYALEETDCFERARGKPRDCYLSHVRGGASSCNHLLKTQEHLNPDGVAFYTAQLQKALACGSSARPTALVLDFFNRGALNDPRPEEPDDVRGPGGRRLQKRRREACEKDYMDQSVNDNKTWILLDGHHKVEAAARLGCTVNFLVVSPCAEPYEPLCEGEEFAPSLAKSVTFPRLWPSPGSPVATWEAARLCSCVAMRLSSSRRLSEAWICKQGCTCFEEEDSSIPPWIYGMMMGGARNATSRRAVVEHCIEVFGKDSELFTTYQNAHMNDLPIELQMSVYQQAYQLPSSSNKLNDDNDYMD